jgi:hypothetical protein
MIPLLIKYGNIVPTTTTGRRVRYHLSLLVVITSDRLHGEFVRLLFLQAHRETDRFFAASGVQLAQTQRGLFHIRRVVFSPSLKVKVGSTLAKAYVVNYSRYFTVRIQE